MSGEADGMTWEGDGMANECLGKALEGAEMHSRYVYSKNCAGLGKNCYA
jgi:hypothetical protein